MKYTKKENFRETAWWTDNVTFTCILVIIIIIIIIIYLFIYLFIYLVSSL